MLYELAKSLEKIVREVVQDRLHSNGRRDSEGVSARIATAMKQGQAKMVEQTRILGLRSFVQFLHSSVDTIRLMLFTSGIGAETDILSVSIAKAGSRCSAGTESGGRHAHEHTHLHP